MLVPVILAGGSGTRLWPLSREAYPKQFIPLLQDQSLFQHTLGRLSHIKDCAKPIVVGNEQHRFLMAEQIRQSSQHCDIILEPCFKGTALAVALAAVHALAQYDSDVLLLVLPADHVIEDIAGFVNTVNEGILAAENGKLVTFGVRPTHAETGYGYIQQGDKLENQQGFTIARFIEKPDQKTAQRLFESQTFLWNSGMFLFSASAFLQELLLHEKGMFHTAKAAIGNGQRDADFIRPNQKDFEQCPTDSIDYAVMEKTINGAVIPLQSTWNDVGAWDALTQLLPQDEQNNVCIGDVVAQKSQNCLIHANQRLVVAVGVKDLVIVETQDAVLVLDKAHAQDVKQVVTTLRDNKRKEVTFHRRVSRPWGSFESIDSGDRFQVKRITVAVGEKLSLQRHHHRSEHWVVVKGTARVTRGDEVFLLSENQSTYIPIGVNHRLENVGKLPLEMIEVQSGAYLGEDDILRLDDQYGRQAMKSSHSEDGQVVTEVN
ncbi:MAG: mannose-1-phosphate guanylyltransferase/mannose-6-phosphate isomerase [Gammaproteobacteria bacterium]|nr:mannose-1-phosphate guanylyltransferase/mannose-6-phosphate isomerase [Gammaproteobacteria bacterium]